MKNRTTLIALVVVFILIIGYISLFNKKEHANINVDLHEVEPDNGAWIEWLEYPTVEELESHIATYGYYMDDLYLRQSRAVDIVKADYGNAIIDFLDAGQLLSEDMTEEEKEEMTESTKISLDNNAIDGRYNYVDYKYSEMNRIDEFTGFYSRSSNRSFYSQDIGFTKVENVYVGYPEGHVWYYEDSPESEKDEIVFELLILTYIDEDLTALKYKEIVEGLDITINGIKALPGHNLLKEKKLKKKLKHFEAEFPEPELEASSLFHEFSHWAAPRSIEEFNILAGTVITTKYQVLLNEVDPELDIEKYLNGTSTDDYILKIGDYETEIYPYEGDYSIEFTKQEMTNK